MKSTQLLPPMLRILVCATAFVLVSLIACRTVPGGEPTAPGALRTQQLPSEHPPIEVEIAFASDRKELQPGECTTLRWQVSAGFGVTLDGQQVAKAGQSEVCPADTRAYSLAVDMGTHVETRQVEIVVGLTRQPQGGQEPATPGVPAYQAGTWVYSGGPLGGLGYDVRMDPRDPDVMYVTDAWAGVFKSTDGGQIWFPINNGIPPYFGPSGDALPIFSLTIDPNNPDTLWAGTQYSSGVFRSDDAGQNWRQMNTGGNGVIEKSISIRGFSIEPGNSEVVYFAGEVSSWEWNVEPLPGLGLDMTKGVIYKTTDGGQSWRRIWYGDNLARYVWIHPIDRNRLYASTGIFDREAANSDPAALKPGGVGVLRSRDGGATWEVLETANGFAADDLYIGSLFMHPQNPEILLAAAGNHEYSGLLGRALGGIYLTEDGGDTWAEVLDGHDFSSVEICPSDPQVVYASTRGGFFRSQDGGRTWQQMAGSNWGPPDVVVGWPIDMQCDPRLATRIFVNAYGGGIFLSEDGGSTWRTASKGYTGAQMRDIVVVSGDPARVYAAARSGLFASTDGGENWLGLGYGVARDLEALTIAVDPADPEHLLAVFIDSGSLPKVSYDSGQTWEKVDTGLWTPDGPWGSASGGITRIKFAPADSTLVFAAVSEPGCRLEGRRRECTATPGHGVIVSRDGGRTWDATALSHGHVMDLAVSADNARVYAALYDGSLHRSDDAGQTWQLVNASLLATAPSPGDSDIPGPTLATLAVDPSNPDKVFVGLFRGGIAISQDGGLSWKASSAGMDAESTVHAFAIDPTDPDVVYAGAADRGVYLSLDGGQTWKALNDGLLTRAVRDLALSSDGSVLYMASEGGGVFRLGTPILRQP